MKKLAVLLPFAVLMTTGAAYAAEADANQLVEANPSTGVVKLLDGRTFTVSQPVLLRGLMPGDHVIVTINDDKSVGISQDGTALEGAIN